MVYFIHNRRAGTVKIGVAWNPVKRMADLQVANADELRLLGCIAALEPDEIELHRRFSRFRIRGEWFQAHPILMAEIRSMLLKDAFVGLDGFQLREFFSHRLRFDGSASAPLEERVGRLVGFDVLFTRWDIYPGWGWGKSKPNGRRFQLIPIQENGNRFWTWHVFENRQLFEGRCEAAASFVDAFHYWTHSIPNG